MCLKDLDLLQTDFEFNSLFTLRSNINTSGHGDTSFVPLQIKH